MSALLGIIFHSVGGFASGSFYMPYNRVKGWSWEIFWLVGGLFSWLIMPLILTAITVPNFSQFIAAADGGMLRIVYLLGLLWGVGGLTYGLGVRYLGMSLGNSVTLGFCSAFGALVPPIYFDLYDVANRTTFTDMLHSTGGIIILVGVGISLLGIIVLGKAGMMKEKTLSKAESQASVKEFNATKGLIVAVISGILSSFFNFGIEAGKPLAEAAIEAGANPLFVNNLAFMVILWGGLTTNLIWTVALIIKNKSYTQFSDISTPLKRNYLLCALAGSTWFLQFFFYGMGESQIGGGASSWILHMSTIILTANMWGIYNKEWKGVNKKIIILFALGIFTMLSSIFLVGIGNSM
jgi:L-rhamnose-H+ transport protein